MLSVGDCIICILYSILWTICVIYSDVAIETIKLVTYLLTYCNICFTYCFSSNCTYAVLSLCYIIISLITVLTLCFNYVTRAASIDERLLF